MATDTPEAELGYLHLLIDHLRPSGAERSGGLENLLARIAQLTEGQAAIILPDGSAIGSPHAHSSLSLIRSSTAVSRVRDAELSAASVVQDGHFIQLIGIGERNPRSVLAVARQSPYPLGVSKLISLTAVALAAYDRLTRVNTIERQLAQALPAARVAVLTQLMSGNVASARKLAEPLIPGVLGATRAQVFLLESSINQRPTVLGACQKAFAQATLTAASLTNDGHVVVIAPVESADRISLLRDQIRAIAARHGCYVGESRAVPLEQVRSAYQMADHALAVARRLPGRIATHNGEHQLAHLLDERAGAWACGLLQPLDDLPEAERQDLVATLRQALRYGHSGAARQLKLNRKTVAIRCNRAETVLGLDLGDMRNRAALDLALQLTQVSASSAHLSPTLSLTEVLASPMARPWAKEFVTPLRADGRPLLRTVRTWIAFNGRVEESARVLKAHVNTVRNHLAACEELLGRRLVGGSGGVHDLVIALQILDDVAPSVLTAA